MNIAIRSVVAVDIRDIRWLINIITRFIVLANFIAFRPQRFFDKPLKNLRFILGISDSRRCGFAINRRNIVGIDDLPIGFLGIEIDPMFNFGK